MYKMKNQTRQLNLLEDFNFPLGDLNPKNRWIVLSREIPWAAIEREYAKLFESSRGKAAIDVRVAFGALLIQKKLNCTDEELVNQVIESPYLQYFLGLKEFTLEAPFGESTLVDFRKRMTPEFMAKANELILDYNKNKDDDSEGGTPTKNEEQDVAEEPQNESTKNKGTLVIDTTCFEANIKYPNDVSLLSDCRLKLEEMIDELYEIEVDKKKPRTYRRKAHKQHVIFSKRRKKSKKVIRKAKRQQLGYVKRNIGIVEKYLQEGRELSEAHMSSLDTIKEIYAQQQEMYDTKSMRIDNRIVSLSQPHVRPIVRGKAKSKVEFGPKVEISVVDGFVTIERFEWDAYNESTGFKQSVENFKEKTGYYPSRVLVDGVYRTRETLKFCKEKGIHIPGKPLGRPKKNQGEVQKVARRDTGDRNVVEGKFGESKIKYGLDRLSTKLKETSEFEVHMAIIVMNLARKVRLSFLLLFRPPFLKRF